MSKPLVTVITPTTHDRTEFNTRIRDIVRSQDYPNIEHSFDYGGGTIGEKRNRLCEIANGTIILHMDSDDFYTPQWVSESVEALASSGADIVGLSSAKFHDEVTNKVWVYDYPLHSNLHGATLCYYKSFWEQHKFTNNQIGEDSMFTSRQKLFSHGYIDGFTATIHAGNTCQKNTSGDRWRRIT